MDIASLWHSLGWPLLRLLVLVSVGLLFANLIESLNWTGKVARLAGPLIRLGRLSDRVGAAFATAFFSGVAANTMLAEAYTQGKLTRHELIVANLFNSLPTYFLHLPTLFFITLPIIKEAAFLYVGLTLCAAFARTFCILLVSRFVSTPLASTYECPQHQGSVNSFRQALEKTWKRFTKRIRTIMLYTVPIYLTMFVLQRQGVFVWLQDGMQQHLGFLAWLRPETMSIIVFHLAAELTAGIAAAGALLDSGQFATREIILALLAGNILSSPMRAVRHQFPYYAGIYSPRLAVELILYSQAFRMVSIVAVGFMYYWLTG